MSIKLTMFVVLHEVSLSFKRFNTSIYIIYIHLKFFYNVRKNKLDFVGDIVTSEGINVGVFQGRRGSFRRPLFSVVRDYRNWESKKRLL